MVTLTGEGFSERDHGQGLQCIFGGDTMAAPLVGIKNAVAVPATLSEANALTGVGSKVQCRSPPLAKQGNACSETAIAVRVTNNRGNSFSQGIPVRFEYYDDGDG